MRPGIQIIFEAVTVCKPKEVNVSIGQDLVKQQINRTRLHAFHRHAQKSGRVVRKPADRIAVFQCNLRHIFCHPTGRFPSKCLRFVRQMLLQIIRRISLEQRADLRIGAVLPQCFTRYVKRHLACLNHTLHLQRLKLRHGCFSAQIPFFCLHLRFQLFTTVSAEIKNLPAGAKPVCFGKSTLEAVTLDALYPLVQIIYAEGIVSCCCSHFMALQNFRSQEARLIQRIIAIDIEGRHLDHNRILSGA